MNNNDDREILRTLDASPSKRIIKNKAAVANPENAIAEILDNAIDYWWEQDYEKDLEFTVTIKAKEQITVSWNMGIPESRWEPLVKMGQPLHQSPYSIGVWGEGFKIAIFSLGEVIDIYSKTGNETIDISIPEKWLEDTNWDIHVFKENSKKIPDDSTLVLIKNLTKKIPNTGKISEFIGETFGTLIKHELKNGHKIKITINGDVVKPISYATREDIENNFAFTPGFEPTEHIIGEVCGVETKIIVGLLAEQDKENYGVYLYGNDRLFAKKLRDESVGFGTRANSIIPAEHPHGMRLQVHIFFNGPPERIPWSAPLKNGFNEKAEISTEIPTWVRDLGEPYIVFVKDTKLTELLPFSSKWTKLSAEKKKEKIFDKSADRRKLPKEKIETEWRNAPDYIKNGINVKNLIDVWDHTTSDVPPKNKPKYDKVFAKKVGKYVLSQRESGTVGSIDISKKLVALSGGSSAAERQNMNEEIKNEMDDDTTQPMSIRLPRNEINMLKISTGVNKPTEVLAKIIEAYKELQALKKTEIFRTLPQGDLEDRKFLQKLRNILKKK